MPHTQPNQKLVAIRRQFSHLSSSSRPKCNLVPTSKSVSPPPLTDQTPKLVDSNENRIISSSEFDLGTNLELYKKRCRALETENARLMDNQGRIITESNRRIEGHLEEIHCLKEKMDAQRRTNGELLRWAQSAEEESRRAKELSREWQNLGQCNNQLMKKELHSHQIQMSQLETKTAKLAAENRELKRLCLYLDEQRQAFWRELSSSPAVKTKLSIRANSSNCQQFSTRSGCSSSEDAGCCRGSSIDTNASFEGGDSPLENVVGRPIGKRETDGVIQQKTVYEQEEVLQAIFSELGNAMASSAEGTSNEVNESANHSLICAPKIIPNDGQMMTIAPAGNSCDNLRPLSNSTMHSDCSSSVASIAKYCAPHFSLRSLDDPTVVLVGHEMNEDGSTLRPTAAEQCLKVHELHTIIEEEDKADGTLQRLVRLEELSRKLAMEEAGDDDPGCSSMVAEAGSMFASLMHCSAGQPLQKQQFDAAEAFGGTTMGASTAATDLMVNSHRNSTGSSSTSSGAFSGISRCTAEEDAEGDVIEAMQGMGSDKGSSDEDLPPRMPLITTNECCLMLQQSLREFSSDQRSSSSMAVCGVTAPEQLILHSQNSTLPRTSLFAEPHNQQNQCAYDLRKKTTDSRKGKSLQPVPFRIRVKPPPTQLLNFANGEVKQQQEKAEIGTNEQLRAQREGTTHT